MDFKKIIKKQMKKQKINIPALARKVEINSQTLYNYLGGKSEMTAGNLEKVFNILNVRVK